MTLILGWLSDPFKGLRDLELGDEKVRLNHLEFKQSQDDLDDFCQEVAFKIPVDPKTTKKGGR